MSNRWIRPLLGLLLLALPLGLAQDVPERSDLRIVVVTHGTAADPFWSVVKNGVDQAAEDLGVTVEYRAPSTFDMIEMGQLIDAAVASQPDGLAVSIPDPDALGDAIRSAADAGIPVVSLNSGSDVAEELGSMLHFGQDEYIAGERAGERMAEQGVSNAVCINQEVGNVALDRRCEGFQDGLGGDVEVLGVRGDFSEIQSGVSVFLQNNPDLEGVLTLGPVGADPTLAALDDAGRLGDLVFGTFDMSPSILEALDEERMSFAIDQQQYLQGYLPVQTLVFYAQYGLLPANETMLTGPNFVTPDTAATVISLSEMGIR